MMATLRLHPENGRARRLRVELMVPAGDSWKRGIWKLRG